MSSMSSVKLLIMNAESVFDTLDQRPNAQLLDQRVINNHYRVAMWQNSFDRVLYNTNKVHTLSVYVQGGRQCRRLDGGNHGAGYTGTVSLLPRYSQSEWQIGDPFRFVHLYFTDESLKRFAAKTLDIEPESLEVPDLTYLGDPKLASMVSTLCMQSFDGDVGMAMHSQERINEVFAHLIASPHYGFEKSVVARGGLSPTVSRALKDYMQVDFHKSITLSDLAVVAGLSEFHLQRMFRHTHGLSPHAFLTEVRIENAIEMMLKGESLSQVAFDCGFSHQSHFNRVFKQHTGATPRQYLLALRV